MVLLALAGCGGDEPISSEHAPLHSPPPAVPEALTQPMISALVPASAHVGDTVTVVGSGLTGTTAVTFNNSSTTPANIADDNHLTVVVPAGCSTGPFNVTNPVGSSAYYPPFTLLETAVPTITDFTPKTANNGSSVTITGTHLGGALAVRVGGLTIATPPPNGTPTSLTFNLGPAVSGAITVVNNVGESAPSTAVLTVGAPPTLLSISPTAGKPGDVVTLTGRNLAGTTNVAFSRSSTNAPFTVVDDQHLQATVPADAGSGGVRVTTAVGTDTAGSFRRIATVAPTISAVSPTSPRQGDPLTVTGSGFLGLNGAFVGGVQVATFVSSDTSLWLYTNGGELDGPVRIVNDAGSATSAAVLTIVRAPVVTAFSPPSAKVGDVVTVSGVHFTGATSARVGAASATPSVANDTQLTVVVPAGATSGFVFVQGPAGSSRSADRFALQAAAAPVITTVRPTTAHEGETIVAVGSGLAGVTVGTIGGFPASVYPTGDDSVNLQVPVGCPGGPISLTSAAGTATSSQSSTILPRAEAWSVQPHGVAPGKPFQVLGQSLGYFDYFGSGGVSPAWAGTDTIGDAQLSAHLPASATTGPLTLQSSAFPGLSVSSYLPLVAASLGPPFVSSLGNRQGAPGAVISLFGSGFLSVTSASMDGVPLLFSPSADEFALVTIPEGATSGPIVLTGLLGTATTADPFTVVPQPTISSFSPTSAKAGDLVTVIGTGLATARYVGFGADPSIAPLTASDTQLIAIVPHQFAGTGPLTVETAEGSGRSSVDFVWNATTPPSIIMLGSTHATVGDRVQVFGSGLAGTQAITVGGVPSFDFEVFADNQIRVRVPPGAGTGPVVVSNSAGTATSAASLFVAPAPTITSLSSSSPHIGDIVLVTGSHFSTVVRVGVLHADPVLPGLRWTRPLDFQIVDDSHLRAFIVGGSPSGTLLVEGGAGSATAPLTITPTAPPTILDFWPETAGPGDYISIAGSNLTGVTQVQVGGVAAAIADPDAAFYSDHAVRIVMPAGASGGAITITTPAGTASSTAKVVAGSPRAPAITAISPTSGAAGARIQITGRRLDSARFGTMPARQIFTSAGELLVIAPTGVGNAFILVGNQWGVAQSPTAFRTQAPVVTGFTPSSGHVGDSVQVQGTGFTGATAVDFNGVAAQFQWIDDHQLTAQVPDGANTGPIGVANSLGRGQSTDSFQVLTDAQGDGGSPPPPPNGGCGCRLAGAGSAPIASLWAVSLIALCLLRRRAD